VPPRPPFFAPQPAPTPAVAAEAPKPAIRDGAAEARELKPVPPALSLEARIGGSLFNWVGILAIIFGVGYFLKYSFDQGWVSPTMRFITGLAGGVLFLGAGHVAFRRSYPILGRGFVGGGMAILHLVLFSGFQILKVANPPHDPVPVIGQGTAFAGMVAVTFIGTWLSISHNSRFLVYLAFIGGLLAPILVSTGETHQAFLFTYLAILFAGFLAISLSCGWTFLANASFLAFLFYLVGFWIKEGVGNPDLSIVFAAVFYALFAAEGVLASLLGRRQPGRDHELGRLVVNSLVFAGATLAALRKTNPDAYGVFLVAASAVHLLPAVLVRVRRPADRALARLFGFFAGVFFLLAPALEKSFARQDLTLAWAVQGAAIFALGLKWGGGWTRGFGLFAIGLAAFRLLAVDTPNDLAHASPVLWNARGFAYGVVTLAAGAAAWLYRRIEIPPDDMAPPGATGWLVPRILPAPERLFSTLVLVVATGIPATLLSFELSDALGRFVKPAYAGRAEDFESLSAHWQTLLFVAYGALTAVISRRRSEPVLLALSLAVIAAAIGKLGLYDLICNPAQAASLLKNPRFLSMALEALCLLWIGREFRLPGRRKTSWPHIASVASVAGHLILLAALSLDWYDAVHIESLDPAKASPPWQGLDRCDFFGLALLWAAYGALLVRRGCRRENRGDILGAGACLVTFAAVAWMGTAFANIERPYADFLQSVRFLASAGIAALAFVAASLARASTVKSLPRDSLDATAAFLGIVGHFLLMLTASVETADLFRDHLDWTVLSTISVVGRWGFPVAAIWALYGAGLTWTGLRLDRTAARSLGLVSLGVGLSVTAVVILFGTPDARRLFLNTRFLGAGLVAAAFFLASRFHRALKKRESPGTKPDPLHGATTIAHLLVMILLTLEAADLFRTHLTWRPDSALSVVGGWHFPVAAIWGVYGLCLFAVGVRLDRKSPRGLGLWSVALGAALSLAFALTDGQEAKALFLNTRFLGAGLAGFALFAIVGIYRMRGAGIEPAFHFGKAREADALIAPLSLLAHAFAIVFCTLEINDFINTFYRPADSGGWLEQKDWKRLSFSLFWTLYAAGMVASGFIRKFKPIRLMALVILAATTLKIFLIDLSFLKNPFRFLSFIALGVLLVLVSFLYQKFKDRLLG
ncbi:MAG: DUF2339 domain-containing protein, partial [Planctomycetota bacterium]